MLACSARWRVETVTEMFFFMEAALLSEITYAVICAPLFSAHSTGSGSSGKRSVRLIAIKRHARAKSDTDKPYRSVKAGGRPKKLPARSQLMTKNHRNRVE